MGWGIPPEGERPVCFFFKEFLLDPSDLGGSLKKEDISLRGGPRNWVEKNRPPAAAVVRSAARGFLKTLWAPVCLLFEKTS